jgi:hypothetical protein
MLIFVQSSSGKSFSWRRAETGIKSVCACLSIASSAIRTAFGIISIDPPRLSAPTTMVPPRVFRPRRPPHSATRTGTPRPAPEGRHCESKGRRQIQRTQADSQGDGRTGHRDAARWRHERSHRGEARNRRCERLSCPEGPQEPASSPGYVRSQR